MPTGTWSPAMEEREIHTGTPSRVAAKREMPTGTPSRTIGEREIPMGMSSHTMADWETLVGTSSHTEGDWEKPVGITIRTTWRFCHRMCWPMEVLVAFECITMWSKFKQLLRYNFVKWAEWHFTLKEPKRHARLLMILAIIHAYVVYLKLDMIRFNNIMLKMFKILKLFFRDVMLHRYNWVIQTSYVKKIH